jgi:hypothetical protein
MLNVEWRMKKELGEEDDETQQMKAEYGETAVEFNNAAKSKDAMENFEA